MIKITQLNETFIDDYEQLVNSKEVHAMTEPNEEFNTFDKVKLLQWLSSLEGAKNRADFAILNEKEEFVGEVVLNEIIDSTANIRIAILPKFFNKGFGTKAMLMAIEYGFKNLNLEKITLGVYNINPRGIRVYEKCGFKVESNDKNDSDIYEIKMSINKNDFKKS